MLRGDEVVRKIKAYREEHGVGLLDARRAVIRQDILDDVRAAETIADLKSVIARMLAYLR